MELILLENVEKLGRKGEVVRVRDGFGRNFLLPRSLALVADESNRKFVDELKAKAAKRHAKEKAEAEGLAQKLGGVKLSFERAVGEKEKLFGSVSADDVREALEQKGYSFEKKQILLKEPIRTLGACQVVVEVYPQVKATVSAEVIAKA